MYLSRAMHRLLHSSYVEAATVGARTAVLAHFEVERLGDVLQHLLLLQHLLQRSHSTSKLVSSRQVLAV
jgi:hypothetical protein